MSSMNDISQKKSFNEKSHKSTKPNSPLNNKEKMKMNSGNHPKDKPDTQAEGPRGKKKTLHIKLEKKRGLTVHKHSEKDALYGALQHVNALQPDMYPRSGKEVLVRGTKGIEAYIHPARPLRCFPEDTHLEISFVESELKANNPLIGRSHKFKTAAVKFYIHALGKRAGKIVQCRQLYKEKKFCVFGFRGETIKQALCRDGRFLPYLENSVWKLTEKPDCTVDSSQLVDDLEGKVFELEFEQGPSSGVASAQNSEFGNRNTEVQLDPSLKVESDKNRENIEKEIKGAKEKTEFLILYENTLAILKNNCIPVSAHKRLSYLSQSVGYLCWNNKGNIGSATCFVFSHQFIFTCWHVVRDIVGQGTDTSEWGRIVSGCATVSFGYEEDTEKGKDLFSLAPWFEVGDEALDYAVLKLNTGDGIQAPSGLYKGLLPVVEDDFMFIIGHPEGKQKSTGACYVMPQSQREQVFQPWRAMLSSVRIPFQRDFKKVIENDDVITYHTSFHSGASGSPLFSPEGLLVGMHTARLSSSFSRSDPLTLTCIECGPSMHAILSHIKQNFPECYLEIVSSQDELILSTEGCENPVHLTNFKGIANPCWGGW